MERNVEGVLWRQSFTESPAGALTVKFRDVWIGTAERRYPAAEVLTSTAVGRHQKLGGERGRDASPSLVANIQSVRSERIVEACLPCAHIGAARGYLVGDRRGWMEERPRSSADTATERRGFRPNQSNLHRPGCTLAGGWWETPQRMPQLSKG